MNSLKLKSLRVGNGLEQKDVAKRLGIAIKTYCDSENGKRPFNIKEIKVLAAIFHLDPLAVDQIFFDGELTNRIREESTTKESA
jgi:DNA-binding XRE family transcriptional regulator